MDSLPSLAVWNEERRKSYVNTLRRWRHMPLFHEGSLVVAGRRILILGSGIDARTRLSVPSEWELVTAWSNIQALAGKLGVTKEQLVSLHCAGPITHRVELERILQAEYGISEGDYPVVHWMSDSSPRLALLAEFYLDTTLEGDLRGTHRLRVLPSVIGVNSISSTVASYGDTVQIRTPGYRLNSTLSESLEDRVWQSWYNLRELAEQMKLASRSCYIVEVRTTDLRRDYDATLQQMRSYFRGLPVVRFLQVSLSAGNSYELEARYSRGEVTRKSRKLHGNAVRVGDSVYTSAFSEGDFRGALNHMLSSASSLVSREEKLHLILLQVSVTSLETLPDLETACNNLFPAPPLLRVIHVSQLLSGATFEISGEFSI